MSNPTHTSIILVSGQWHTEFHIQPCLEPLRNVGYRIIPSPLLCAGIKEPRPTYADELKTICSKIESEIADRRYVCVVAHSASAIAVCESLNQFLSKAEVGAREKLMLVFLAGFLNRERALKKYLGKGLVKVDPEAGIMTAINPAERFYNDMPPAEAEKFAEALQPATIWSDLFPLSSDAWKSVRKTYILCLQDHAQPIESQRAEADENGFEIVELDGGHCPFIGHPDRFVDAMNTILKP